MFRRALILAALALGTAGLAGCNGGGFCGLFRQDECCDSCGGCGDCCGNGYVSGFDGGYDNGYVGDEFSGVIVGP